MTRSHQAVKLPQEKYITFKAVNNGVVRVRDFQDAAGLITVDVYEGRRKLGRFTLKDAVLKFR